MFAGELRKQKALFAAVDVVALLIAFGAALAIHDPEHSQEIRLLETDPRLLFLGSAVLIVICVGVFLSCDLYRMRAGGSTERAAIVRACSYAGVLTVIAGFLAHADGSRLTVSLGYLFSIPAVLIGRITARYLVRRIYSNPRITIPIVIVGFNEIGRYLFDQISDQMTFYEPVGFVDQAPAGRQYRGLPVLEEIGRAHV